MDFADFVPHNVIAMKRALDAVCTERNIKMGTAEAEHLAERAIALFQRGVLDENQLHMKLRQDA